MSLRLRLALAFAVVAIGTAGVIALATPLVIDRGFAQIGLDDAAPASPGPGHGTGGGQGPGAGAGAGPGAGGQRLAEIRQTMVVTIVLVAGGAALVASLLGVLAARRLTRPIRDLERAATAVAGGDLAARSGLAGRTDELGDLGRSFDAMAAGLARGDTERRQFTQDAVHELRTPITVIEATTSAVLDGVYPHTDEHLRTVRDQARLLTRIVDDLRTISLAEGGRLELRREPVELAAIVAGATRDFEGRAREAGVTLVVDLPPVAVTVPADPDRLRQVMAAILDNAVRHTPAGGRVTVGVQVPRPGRARIEVHDTGPGIAPDDLPFVFDRLYQADPARDRRTGSSGLGLAIVRALIEAHGGRVGAEAPSGGGALVWVELPRA